MSDVVAALIAALGEKSVLLGGDVSSRRAGFFRSDTIKAKAIVRPRTTEDVSAAMRVCNEHDQHVIAHGGLTGLAGAALTTPEDVVISLELMNQIEEVNTTDRTMVVQSGVILQTIQEAAEAEALLFPLDLGGRGSCTIGGNISTNAGGNRVIRYGMTRNLVLGIEAVLMDGTVVSSMNRMIKNNAGYDLKQLFIGSEGSLGVVTRAVLKLQEQPRSQETMLVALDSFPKVIEFLRSMESALGGSMSAFEVMWNDYYELVTTAPAENQPPLEQGYPFYILVEAMGGDPQRDHARVEEALAECFEQALIVDAVISQSQAQTDNLWAIRDDVSQVRRRGPSYAFDVSMRLSRMEEYLQKVDDGLSARYQEFSNVTFGHLGDGNLHLNISVGEHSVEARAGIEECVYEALRDIGGSVSAEHGVGLEKKAYLDVSRSEDEINLMRTLKQALDPKGLLNRGKIFDLAS